MDSNIQRRATLLFITGGDLHAFGFVVAIPRRQLLLLGRSRSSSGGASGSAGFVNRSGSPFLSSSSSSSSEGVGLETDAIHQIGWNKCLGDGSSGGSYGKEAQKAALGNHHRHRHHYRINSIQRNGNE